jgi:hypothetical protein
MLKSLGSNLSLNPRSPKTNSWPAPDYIHTSRSGGLLTSKRGLWLSDNRLLKYQAQLLECPDISLQVCSALNPASLLSTEECPITHSCEEVLAKCYSARPDLLDQSLPDPDLNLLHQSKRELDGWGQL